METNNNKTPIYFSDSEVEFIYESVRNFYDSVETPEGEEVYNSILKKL